MRRESSCNRDSETSNPADKEIDVVARKSREKRGHPIRPNRAGNDLQIHWDAMIVR